MLERIAELPGVELDLDAYFADFDSRLWQVDATWKLERRQSFQKPDVPSWTAWAEGDHQRAAAPLLSVLALIGVGVSLVLQARESKANRRQASRSLHTEPI